LRLLQVLAEVADMLGGEAPQVGILRVFRSFLKHPNRALMLIDHVFDKFAVELSARFFAEAPIGAILTVVFVEIDPRGGSDTRQLGVYGGVICHEFLRETFHVGIAGAIGGKLRQSHLGLATVGGFCNEAPIRPAQFFAR
jgi:hypothetical protein